MVNDVWRGENGGKGNSFVGGREKKDGCERRRRRWRKVIKRGAQVESREERSRNFISIQEKKVHARV